MKEDKSKKSANVDRVTAYVRDFRHGCLWGNREGQHFNQWGFIILFLCASRESKWEGEGTYPDHRTEGIADDEEGEAKEGFDGRDVKVGLNTLEAGSVNCGTNVDRSREEADLESDEELLGGRPILRVLLVIGVPVDEEMVAAFLLIYVWGFLCVRGFLISVMVLCAGNIE